jgi:hypothetical protein
MFYPIAGLANPGRVMLIRFAPTGCRTGKKQDIKLISLLHTSWINYISLNAWEQGFFLN